jgi:uncharacterized protein YprB with RNaseH-like and TPR domain
VAAVATVAASEPASAPSARPEGFGPEWWPLSDLVLQRTLLAPLPAPLPAALSADWSVLEPAAAAAFASGPCATTRLAFFDLETTGLSGGAGTVAFLAAVGRLTADRDALSIVQYLLLDYPGEPDFLQALVADLEGGDRPPILATYNGKSFDAPLLRTRCLMNGLKPAEYLQLDLLHPGSRLWRRRLADCSLVSVERSLGLDRGPDLDGAEAPEAWFAFLRSGAGGRLLEICDHNRRDLVGLAAVAARLAELADRPEDERLLAEVDGESLALAWSAAAKRAARAASGADGEIVAAARLTEAVRRSAVAERLLALAAASGGVRAGLELAGRRVRQGRRDEAEGLLRLLLPDPERLALAAAAAPAGANGLGSAESRRLAGVALRLAALAARRRDWEAALDWLDAAAAVPGWPEGRREEMAARRARWTERRSRER